MSASTTTVVVVVVLTAAVLFLANTAVITRATGTLLTNVETLIAQSQTSGTHAALESGLHELHDALAVLRGSQR